MRIRTVLFGVVIICALFVASVGAQQAGAPSPAVFQVAAQPHNGCLLVKHKGTVGRRLAWFFLIGVPIAPGAKYDYIDSIDYTSTRMSYGGKHLLKIQDSGVHVIVLNEKFTATDLASARSACFPTTKPVLP